ncbi:MAG: DoxX family protein [Gammaproteobacteria bacterium]|nr:DoxX family protein [Gammaproteobacteria bacterium]MDD9824852.1 DoxX family protein [Gammaproteobacteria bacterium]
MPIILNAMNRLQDLLDQSRIADGLGLLLIRIYLFFPFWMGGTRKLSSPEHVIAWFDQGLGLPFPTLMFWLAALTEAVGAVLLLFGFATRWISIPLMITMLVAAFAVHWEDGWYAIAQSSSEEIGVRLDRAKDILQEHGDYEWLTEYGNFAILGNGIEFAATYFIMLLVLFFAGGGRFLSADYWIARKFRDSS